MNVDRFRLIAAVFILLVKDNKIFLSKRMNTGWEDGKWSIIGGHIDGNETARLAAQREAREETGVTIDLKDLEFFNVAHIITNSERVQFSFFTKTWEGEPKNNEPEKASEVKWFSFDYLPENMTEISKDTIKWYLEKKVYAEFGWDRK